MKRNILLPCFALILTAVLAGCSNTASTVSPSPSAPAVAPSESPMPENSSDPVARGFDRAMDDIGNTVDRIGDAARNGVSNGTNGTWNSGNGGGSNWAAGTPGGELQSTTR